MADPRPTPIEAEAVVTRPTLRDALKSARNVFLFGFLGILGPALLGWLGQVKDWADSSGGNPFPSTSALGYVAISAGIAAAPAALAGIWRAAQVLLELGNPPSYAKAPVAVTYHVDDGPPADRPAD
jgi:hypothetical protein